MKIFKHIISILILTIFLNSCYTEKNTTTSQKTNITVDNKDINNSTKENIDIEIKPINEKLMLYKNHRLGFEFVYPKTNFWEEVTVKELDNIIFLLHNDYQRELFEKLNKDDNIFNKSKDFIFAFIVEDIKNKDELKTFIKNKYWEECDSFEMMKMSKEDIFDIQIINTSSSVKDSSGCMINYVTHTLYSPKHKKIISWDVWQECSFDNCDIDMKVNFLKK